MSLFDAEQRRDSSPARHTESKYEFLNRVKSDYFGRTRDLLEAWYSAYPDDDGHLVTRFRAANDRSHLAAFWELYLHAMYRSAGFDVEVHPTVDATSEKKPDFLIHGEQDFVVEARLIVSPAEQQADEARTSQIYEALNQIDSPNFSLWASVEAAGDQIPSLRDLRTTLEAWLASLDPDEVSIQYTNGEGWRSLPGWTWEARGWRIGFQAIPKKQEARRREGSRPLGVYGPGGVGVVDHHTPLTRTLKSKAPSRYGRFDQPFVTAVLSDIVGLDDEDVASALFGSEAVRVTTQPDHDISTEWIRQPNGFWHGPVGFQNTRVTGVLIGRNLMPWSIARSAPRLWLNPYSQITLAEEDRRPWSTALPDQEVGEMRFHEALTPAHDVAGVAEDWPGPEDLV